MSCSNAPARRFLSVTRSWLRAALRVAVLAGTVSGAGAQTAAAPAGEPRFDILEFVVEGNTALATEVVERAVYPHLGPDRGFDDVEAARRALEAAYRSAGFGLAGVDIPEQRADTGVIRLVVSEGRVARTRVLGAHYFSQGYILERVPGVEEGRVPHLPSIQAQLLDVNRSADRRVAPVLRPGLEPGTTEVDLTVQDAVPVHGSLTLNNQASRSTSPTRLQLALSHDNLFQRDHALAVQAVVSPENTDEVRVISASYTVPLGPAGLESLVFSATRSDSRVFAGVGSTQLFGKGSIVGVRRSFALEVADGRFQLFTLGADYKDLVDTVQAGEGQGFDTPIRYLPLSAGWTGSFRRPEGDWQLGATVGGGLRGLVNRQSEFADKRFEAKASYAWLRVDARFNRTLPWAGLRLRLLAEGQVTPDPLISNEQFVLGGAGSVRGYHEAEAVADLGLRSSVQLATPDLAPTLGWKWLGSLGAHVFLDAGVGELRRPLPGQTWRFRLAGAGLGLQASGGGAWPVSLSLDLGWPLLRRGVLGDDGLRIHASASVGF